MTDSRHGRDMKLIVWKLGEADEDHLSTALPVEDVPTPRAQPWVLHLLEVNTLNFCAFAICSSIPGLVDNASEVLIAVPNTLNSDAVRTKLVSVEVTKLTAIIDRYLPFAFTTPDSYHQGWREDWNGHVSCSSPSQRRSYAHCRF